MNGVIFSSKQCHQHPEFDVDVGTAPEDSHEDTVFVPGVKEGVIFTSADNEADCGGIMVAISSKGGVGGASREIEGTVIEEGGMEICVRKLSGHDDE
jgi:hypothetical protein